MRDIEINPLKNIIYNKNQPTQPTQPNRLNRNNCSFWMLPNIAKGFRTYSKFSGKSIGECVEEAFLEYMKNHPLEQVSLNVTTDMRTVFQDISTRIEMKLTINELQKILDLLYKYDKIGNTLDYEQELKKLQKTVRKAIKFSANPQMRTLLEKAEEFI